MPDKPPPKRPRSEAQMIQKRHGDRIKHRTNRAETKLQMQRMEDDISFLRAGMADVLTQLRLLQSAAGPANMCPSFPPQVPVPGTAPVDDPIVPETKSLSAFGVDWVAESPTGLPLSAKQGQEQAALPPSLGSQINCRCGIVHQDRSYCVEFASFTLLYQSQVTLMQRPCLSPQPLPRTPSLDNFLLHSTYDNPLSFYLGPIIRCFETHSIETLFGIYFLAYRLLRWRLQPDAESLKDDVPEWLRPTEVQESVPHTVCVDYIPWPSLRNYLCLHQNEDTRHCAQLYMKSFRLRWPPGRQLLVKTPAGGFTVDESFEAIASDLTMWTMGSPWIETFPHLMEHVTSDASMV